MPERMKPYLPSCVLLLLIAYLGVQALTGERGLLSGGERDAMLERREAQLGDILEQKRDLEVRVRYLRRDSLSRDLLEERARAVLGPHRVAVDDRVLDHQVVALAQPRHPRAQFAQHVVARMVRVQDQEQGAALGREQTEGAIDQ